VANTKIDSVSHRGRKISACGFLKRIGSVRRRVQIDGGVAVEKNGGSPERIAFGELDPNSGGGFLTVTRPRPVMGWEDIAAPEVGG
jgi:hypothetical protein